MSILTISLFALAVTSFILVIKELKPDFAVLISVAFGVIVLLYLTEPISQAVSAFVAVSERIGMNNDILTAAVRVIGISLVAEFAASACADAGQTAIAAKVEAAGKIIILSLSLPIITSLLDSIFSILS